jgi:hypothetical protein
MFVLSAIINIKVGLVQDAVPKRKELIFSQNMSLDEIRKKVIFHNSIDVWIAACTEKNIVWSNPDSYKKFISYLLKNNLNLKAFSLCAHEAGATEQEKTRFADSLAESKDPNAATYTIKLNDSSLNVIRKFDFKN